MTLSSLAVAVFALVVAAGGSAAADHRYGSASNRRRIHVAGLIPLTSHDTGDDWGERVDKPAPDVLQAVLMALSDVNGNRRILRDYELHLDWKDTEVRYWPIGVARGRRQSGGGGKNGCDNGRMAVMGIRRVTTFLPVGGGQNYSPSRAPIIHATLLTLFVKVTPTL